MSFTSDGLSVLRTMLERGVNAPYTTSVGRLFDAVASIAGLQQVSSYEGQAAMALEFALRGDGEYRFDITESAAPGSRLKTAPAAPPLAPGSDEAGSDGARSRQKAAPAAPQAPGPEKDRPRWTVDWAPMVTALLGDMEGGTGPAEISARFHNGLAEAAIGVARRIGENRVVLSGGCFQNRCLTERVVHRLREEGFRPYWHQRVPPNDGGIALGQIAVAAELTLKEQAMP
jgi:hydrogenase maturation protein HypF